MSSRHTVIPSVNVFIVNNGKMLLSRRINTGWKDGWLCVPGGHVEKGETPKQAMIREINEELGVTVEPQSVEFLCVAVRKSNDKEYVAYEFMIDNATYSYDFINNEVDKCEELVWADITHLPDDTIEDFAYIIKEGLRA